MATEYLLYNSVTHKTITLCDYDDGACIAALQEEGFYMLSPETYGDKYAYPAIYKSPGIVWDQSEANTTNGEWTMMSREIGAGDIETLDSGKTESDGQEGVADTAENPVAVIYNDGRRNNSGMGLYYLRGTHEIGLAPHGVANNETPSKFIPLWMSEGKDIRKDLPDFPRPGGAREGNTTGIVKYRGCLLYTSPSPRDRG